jgi:hypothetical protein
MDQLLNTPVCFRNNNGDYLHADITEVGPVNLGSLRPNCAFIQETGPIGIGFRTPFGGYLQAYPNLEKVAIQHCFETWEAWKIIELEEGKVALKSYHKSYLSAQGSKVLHLRDIFDML